MAKPSTGLYSWAPSSSASIPIATGSIERRYLNKSDKGSSEGRDPIIVGLGCTLSDDDAVGFNKGGKSISGRGIERSDSLRAG